MVVITQVYQTQLPMIYCLELGSVAVEQANRGRVPKG